jgi:hypothetical protein
MNFRYFALNEDGGWDAVSEVVFQGAFSEVKWEVERHFEGLVGTIKAGQIIVHCTDLGDKPGQVVAAEAVYMAHVIGKVKPPPQARSLIWLVEDNVPKR